MVFKLKKEDPFIELINFSARHLSTGQVGEYILRLYNEEGLRHIGYTCENRNGSVRFVLYTLNDNLAAIEYFLDRCPGMIEESCRKLEGCAHQFNKWENGFEEVKYELI